MTATSGRRIPALPFLLPGIIALVAAVWGGLVRLPWALSVPHLNWVAWHGPLILNGFFGTLIAVERAVAMKRAWTWLGPAASGTGGLLLIAGFGREIFTPLFVVAAIGYLAVSLVIAQRQKDAAAGTMALGAVALLIGNLLLLSGFPVFSSAPWWEAFLVLMIAGERLELTRFLGHSARQKAVFHLTTVTILAGLAAGIYLPVIGARFLGLGYLALAAWLLLFDMARKSLKRPGLQRFVAVNLLTGYVWLGASGAIRILLPWQNAGLLYDAALHSIFLGFTLSMIFGHAPVIFPSVIGLAMEYRNAFYAHTALLHLSLAARIVGDLSADMTMRRWGGVMNAAAILLFFLNTALAAIAARRGRGV